MWQASSVSTLVDGYKHGVVISVLVHVSPPRSPKTIAPTSVPISTVSKSTIVVVGDFEKVNEEI